MAAPIAESYSHARYNTRQVLQVSGDDISLSGTQASASTITRTTALSNIRVLDGYVQVMTGGTAAGPGFTLNVSAAGTGANVPFGTVTFGTHANNTIIDVSLTETAIAAGSDIVCVSVAGTAASTPVFAISLGYTENFVVD